MKKAYFFDFDGTLTYHDTMFLYLKFYNPRKFYFNFIKFTPLFILLKLGLADTEKVKKGFIASILKGQKRKKIEAKSQLFFDQHFPKIFRENALEFIEKIDQNHTESYFVTASLDIWAKPFADELKAELIATKAEFKNDIFTGNFIGKNCNGAEKVSRIKKAIAGKKIDKTIAFGDTSGDKEMLAFADESHYEFFH